MLRIVTHYWWMILLRGILAILFGIAAFIWPGLTIEVLVLLFDAYALVDGIFAVIVGIQQYGENERWWINLLEGIAGIVLGVLTLLWPGTTATVLLAFIAAWVRQSTGRCRAPCKEIIHKACPLQRVTVWIVRFVPAHHAVPARYSLVRSTVPASAPGWCR
jgi:hypothetical protein